MAPSVPERLRREAIEASALEAFEAILTDEPRAARLCAPEGTCVVAYDFSRPLPTDWQDVHEMLRRGYAITKPPPVSC